jgi:FAD/FMN-containing dehydrogenase
MVVPTGINSTTGIAGLCLGGGMGWLSRKYGMAIDNLVSATIVDHKGDTVVCDFERHADLFWAGRGGK